MTWNALRADLARLNPTPSTILYAATRKPLTWPPATRSYRFSALAKSLRNGVNDVVREQGRERELTKKEYSAERALRDVSEDSRDMTRTVALEDRQRMASAIGDSSSIEAHLAADYACYACASVTARSSLAICFEEGELWR